MACRRQKQRVHRFLVVLFLLLLCLLMQFSGAETQIKWTPGADTKDNAAATAPRSQRYWDENNIERPDYAKTDQEIAAEKRAAGKEDASSWRIWGVALVCVIGAIGYYAFPILTGGNRLGGNRHLFVWNTDTAEEARKARLEKFEKNR